MAKLARRKKTKVRIDRVAIVAMVFSLTLWLFATIAIKTRNTSLTMKIQKMQDELIELSSQNQTLNIQIQSLENKERVYEVAVTANMNQIQDNIISIIGD